MYFDIYIFLLLERGLVGEYIWRIFSMLRYTHFWPRHQIASNIHAITITKLTGFTVLKDPFSMVLSFVHIYFTFTGTMKWYVRCLVFSNSVSLGSYFNNFKVIITMDSFEKSSHSVGEVHFNRLHTGPVLYEIARQIIVRYQELLKIYKFLPLIAVQRCTKPILVAKSIYETSAATCPPYWSSCCYVSFPSAPADLIMLIN